MPKDIMKAVEKIASTMKAKVMKNASLGIKYNKPLLFSALSAHNISFVEVQFDGSCDSGQMEEPEFFRGAEANRVRLADTDDVKNVLVEGALISNESTWDAKKKEWVYTTKTPTISELVESICYDLLENKHEGWEINAGSYGEFELKVGDTEIALEYNERVEEVNEYNETY
jgi:hypothetical protein